MRVIRTSYQMHNMHCAGILQEYPDLKVVKVEHDANKKLIADHKVSSD